MKRKICGGMLACLFSAVAQAGVVTDEGCRMGYEGIAQMASCADGKLAHPGGEHAVAYPVAAARLQERGYEALLVHVGIRNESRRGIAAEAHVPYFETYWDAEAQEFRAEVNPRFAEEIERLRLAKGLSHEEPVFLICRSGDISVEAAGQLAGIGYRHAYSIAGGLDGAEFAARAPVPDASRLAAAGRAE